MFRLTVILCAGLYGSMLVLGQDNGQLRFGLMQAEAEKIAADAVVSEPIAQPAVALETAQTETVPPVVAAAFVPEKPLIASPAAEATAPETDVIGKVFYIASDKANVREGPGKDHAVIDALPKGEAVLVLSYGEGPEGWSHIRIEGDGVEGYIASRLLTE